MSAEPIAYVLARTCQHDGIQHWTADWDGELHPLQRRAELELHEANVGRNPNDAYRVFAIVPTIPTVQETTS